MTMAAPNGLRRACRLWSGRRRTSTINRSRPVSRGIDKTLRDFVGAILQKRQNRGSRHTTDKDELLGGFQLQPHGREVKLESRALLKNVKAEIPDIGPGTPIH